MINIVIKAYLVKKRVKFILCNYYDKLREKNKVTNVNTIKNWQNLDTRINEENEFYINDSTKNTDTKENSKKKTSKINI